MRGSLHNLPPRSPRKLELGLGRVRKLQHQKHKQTHTVQPRRHDNQQAGEDDEEEDLPPVVQSLGATIITVFG